MSLLVDNTYKILLVITTGNEILPHLVHKSSIFESTHTNGCIVGMLCDGESPPPQLSDSGRQFFLVPKVNPLHQPHILPIIECTNTNDFSKETCLKIR